jgi:cytoskeletal protein CcmA (bactofilin family)
MNFNRRDRIGEPAEPPKTALKPAIYEPPGSPASKPATAPTADAAGIARSHAGAANPMPATAAPGAAPAGDVPQSRLFVGVHIKLKGVEISDCDAVVIEGNVEATVHSKALEIAPPGTLHGTADIDVAEIHGEFAGDLTVRTRLVIHGTGRVSGTIRYGKLVVAEGGEISGDVRRRDESEDRSASGSSASGNVATVSGAGVATTTGGGTRGALAPSSERWSN